MFAQLVTALYNEGDSVKALKVLDFAEEKLPGSTVRHDYVSTTLAEYYYKLGEYQKGNAIMEAVANDCVENLDWYYSLRSGQRASVTNRIGHNIAVLGQILRICDQEGQKPMMDKYLPVYMKYTQKAELN